MEIGGTVRIISPPSIVFIYLGRYPTGWVKQVAWIIFWVTLLSVVELVNYIMGLMSYHNGWNFGWSENDDRCGGHFFLLNKRAE
ncbi:hypothetical protein [Neobacillus niacini]|uniref:hypothetical protein n=1 Tax=Neobacillus niacini TaxID=86668 RepID=UPI002859630D|nr:hypothetical protein [Neobacillus niacini]MDR6998308.1 hypothetical protein [Neobacillus niacini]